MTSLTHPTVWTFTAQPGADRLVALPLEPFAGQPPVQMEVFDLVEGMPDNYWVGRVVCAGQCRRFVFCALIECEDPPKQIACPRCKGSAIPDAHWRGGMEITCKCGKRGWVVSGQPVPDPLPGQVRCGRCGGFATTIERWPLLD